MTVGPRSAAPPERLRVLFIQSQAFFGADSELHLQLMKYLDRSRAEVHVACTVATTPSDATSARYQVLQLEDVHRLDVNFGDEFRFRSRSKWLRTAPRAVGGIAKLIAYARKHRIQVIHATEKPRDIATATLVARLIGAKVVLHLHVGLADWISPVARAGIMRADRVIAISDFVGETAVAWGIPPERIRSVHNALDVTAPRWNVPSARAQVRAELGLEESTPVIGIVSRLFRWKGHQRLVDALPALRAEFPGVRLVIVGEDDPRATPGEAPLSTVLREQAHTLGVSDALLFTGFRTDVAALMDAFDVFAMPSWDEPFGMVYLEAAIRDRPVVGLDRGGPREIIRDGVTGYLVHHEDPARLASVLGGLLRDPALRARMAEAARADLFARFTSRHMAEGVLAVYEDLVRSRRPARAAVEGRAT